MIYVVLGTKGQFMKMFPVMKLFDKYKVDYKFIHTGQHFGIIEDNIKRFGIKKPDVYLTIKKEDLRNIWEMMMWIPRVLWNSRKLKIKKNDWVLIHGDAESTLLGLIIGKFFRAKVVHIEAGERSKNIFEPFPEELIRIFSDWFADVCFCSYGEFRENIKYKKETYVTFGNTIFDSVELALKQKPAKNVEALIKTKFVLFLIHRKENVFIARRLNAIINILEEILKRGFKVVWPIHTNTKFELEKQNVWERIQKLKAKYDLSLSYFFDYVDFMHLVKNCEFVASDGGGLQDETYFLNKPLLILRNVAEQSYNLNKTSYLSMLDLKKVNFFLDNYKNFKTDKKIKNSPSKIIVDYFIKKLNK